MTLRPFSDESASSLVWRCARHEQLTLSEYCSWILNMRYSHKVGDIDSAASGPYAGRFASVLGITSAEIEHLACPTAVARGVWCANTRSHTGKIWVCPECLNEELGYARRDWQSVLGVVCPEHGRFLVGRCQACGEVLRYRVREGTVRFGHWLEQWPICPACGSRIEAGAKAPHALVEMAADWRRVLRGRPPRLVEDELRIAARLVCRMAAMPSAIARLRREIDLPADSDWLGVGALIGFLAYRHGLYACKNPEANLYLRCLLGLPVDETALARVFALGL